MKIVINGKPRTRNNGARNRVCVRTRTEQETLQPNHPRNGKHTQIKRKQNAYRTKTGNISDRREGHGAWGARKAIKLVPDLLLICESYVWNMLFIDFHFVLFVPPEPGQEEAFDLQSVHLAGALSEHSFAPIPAGSFNDTSVLCFSVLRMRERTVSSCV